MVGSTPVRHGERACACAPSVTASGLGLDGDGIADLAMGGTVEDELATLLGGGKVASLPTRADGIVRGPYRGP